MPMFCNALCLWEAIAGGGPTLIFPYNSHSLTGNTIPVWSLGLPYVGHGISLLNLI